MLLPWTEQRPTPNEFGPEISSSITKREAAWLRANANGKVLEIGAAFGFSTIVMATQPRVKFVVSVDPHETHQSYDPFQENLAAYKVADKVLPMKVTSDVAWPLWPSAVFDFVFVDGSHFADDVVVDALEAWRVTKTGGLLAFHDYGEDTCPGVEEGLDYWSRQVAERTDLVDTLAIFRVA